MSDVCNLTPPCAAGEPHSHIINSGRKDDQAKPRMDLLPPTALREIASVLTVGAERYGAYNWAQGMDWSRLIGAAYRHLAAFQAGENNDPDSQFSHAAHLACCAIFLLTYQQTGIGKDDRYKYEIKK